MKKKAVAWMLFLAPCAMVSFGVLAQSEKAPTQRVLLDEKAAGVYITFVNTYTSDIEPKGRAEKEPSCGYTITIDLPWKSPYTTWRTNQYS